jgi:hypothetical protein
MIQEALDSHVTVIDGMRTAINNALEANDPGTAGPRKTVMVSARDQRAGAESVVTQ